MPASLCPDGAARQHPPPPGATGPDTGEAGAYAVPKAVGKKRGGNTCEPRHQRERSSRIPLSSKKLAAKDEIYFLAIKL